MRKISVALQGAAVLENKHRLLEMAEFPVEITELLGHETQEQWLSRMAEVDVLITNEWSLPIPDFKNLKLLQVHAAGYEKIDLSCLPPSTVVCRSGGHGPAIAEYVLMAMLAASHELVSADQALRRGQWEFRGMYRRPLRRELSQSVVGVMGYGEIGQAVAELISPLSREFLVCNRSRPRGVKTESWYPMESIEEFLAQCDFVVVSLPLNDETDGLIGAEQLSAMKETAVLINVGRGQVVDQAALFVSLSEKRIGGAVLDVWWRYPASVTEIVQPADLSFGDLSNVILTPHVSGWSENTLNRRWDIILKNITAIVLEDGKPSGLVERA